MPGHHAMLAPFLEMFYNNSIQWVGLEERGSSEKGSTQPKKLRHLFPFSLFMWLNMIGPSLTIECVGM